MLRVAIVGCGSITRRRHLPALLANPDTELVALVDAAEERAHALRVANNLSCSVLTDYRGLSSAMVDAVILALPTSLHTEATLSLLGQGVNVLCEKPLAVTAAEAQACYDAAQKHRLLLVPALHWRFYHGTTMVQHVLDEGLLGSLLHYDWEWGMPYDWPSFDLSRKQMGTGILFDQGIHLIDCLLGWFGAATEFAFASDDWGGGFDANGILSLRHRSPSHGTPLRGRVRLSHTYALKNRLVVQGTKARLELHRGDPETVLVYSTIADTEVAMSLRSARADAGDAFSRQLSAFVGTVENRSFNGSDVKRTVAAIELIERCYQDVSRIDEPWAEHPDMSQRVCR